MFDFLNLDEVDVKDAAPEWLKWQGVPDWQRAKEDSPAVLEDLREEEYAAPQDEYKFEKLDIPNLNEDTAYDPLGLLHEDLDAIEDNYAQCNGAVIMNFITGAYEEYQAQEFEKDQKQAYINSLHEERLQIVANTSVSPGSAKGPLPPSAKEFDRKMFAWREVQSPLVAQYMGLPDGGSVAEMVLASTSKILKNLGKFEGICCVPPSTLLQMLIALGQMTRPQPSSQRITRSTIIHLAVTDVFFPAAMLIDDAEDIISFKKGAPPQIAHLVAISINKEMGDVEPKHLLENIKLGTPSNMPKQRRL
jgi:hypothetical protein